jgi:hypothetical protein
MDGVHGNAPCRFAVLVVVGNQDLHVRSVNQAALAYSNHAGLLRDIVPRLEDPRGVGLDRNGGSDFVQ